MKNRHSAWDPRDCPICLARAKKDAQAGQPPLDVIWKNGPAYYRRHNAGYIGANNMPLR